MPRSKRNFTPEYREEAVKSVIETSRPVAQVAKELGINPGTLSNWVAAYRRDHAGEEPPLTVNERARLRELERETRELQMELTFLKKAAGVLRQGSSMSERFEFIDAEYADNKAYKDADAPSIVQMCRWFGVGRSSFNEWRNRPVSVTAKRRADLKLIISKSFEESDDTYGYRRVHADLVDWGVPCGLELVRVLMRELGLEPCQPRPWRHGLTERDGLAGAIPDLVERDFTAEAPGLKMVGDITYISTWEGWLYLATVIDCHTKAVVGWAMDDNYKTPLIEAAIEMAVRNHELADGAIFHSDRGSNYTSAQFAATLKKNNLRQSVGRTGICYDNAMAESFFGTLKNERIYRTEYPTREHARRDVARYIELRYNTKRRHSGLGYRTPQQAHDEYLEKQLAA
ncbi:IS3 family transposase [Kribbella qitaiheensis]|uniref:IS3 family transposase n=1 Tax=Kribbella qitaiheensis TaxID=1544730 RepID=A0A7G6WZK7_9ACTN|nr:IS3 family transposase [Kribbella qitaiheensis]QNE16622.1 IS3 family transposase [Kribbella qitaiheensis]QNE19422.1 IS3 family transposase [Kribbella qitaiheensis]QNE20669.1 IS3 family transposase [Kribbella qitaiheensis]